ncbi:MAG: hypothetical protein U0269_00950 [Polyangiales bacterium]
MQSRCSVPPTPSDAGDAGDVQSVSDVGAMRDSSDASIVDDTEALTRACAVLVSCEESSSSISIASCVNVVRYFADPALVPFAASGTGAIINRIQCALSQNNCRDYLNCATLSHGPTYCDQHPSASCDGNVAITCPTTASWASSAVDCAAFGLQCRISNARATCSTGAMCSTSYTRCDGPRRLQCSGAGTYQTQLDCSQWPGGGTCQMVGDAGAQAECAPTAGGRAVCTGSSVAHCVGSVLHQCLEPGLPELEMDCTSRGGRCEVGDAGRGSCVPTVNECSSSSPDRCDGATLVTCIDGRWRRIPCSSVWRSLCVVNGTDARCTD